MNQDHFEACNSWDAHASGPMEAQVAHFAHPKNDNTIDYVII